MKRTWIIVLMLTLVTVTLIVPRSARLFKKPSTLSRCPEGVTTAAHSTAKIRASKIIVEPWDGRHNVYGVFVLPAGYEAADRFAVNVDASGSYCGWATVLDRSAYGLDIKPGERIVIGHLRTRTALWLLTQGKQDELTQPQNWLLGADKS